MFTKLFSSITTSSIWNEDNNTRILWITMLAMSNKNGYVSASVGGLAHEARISKEDCEKALKVLSSPDDDSRSKEFDGRRIEIIDGGFQLLNHAKYRAIRSEEDRREYMKEYMAKYRLTKNVNNSVNNVNECKPALTGVNHSKPSLAQAEADTEAEEDKKEEGFESIIRYWNSKDLPKCKAVSKGRRSSLNQRLKEEFFVNNCLAAIDKIMVSDFLIGKNDRGWRADIDWFLKPDSVPRIMEGKYDNKSKVIQNKERPSYQESEGRQYGNQ